MENISKLLKDWPKGTKLYSPICGECELESIDNDIEYTDNAIVVKSCVNNKEIYFYRDGRYFYGMGECMLFPSKENRDWNTFKPELEHKFKVGDKVMSNAGGVIFEIVSIDDYGYNCTALYDKTHGFYFGYTAEDEYHQFTPKFKVGDKICYKTERKANVIKEIRNDRYITKNAGIRFEDEFLYNLVKSSEFKPFDKVLVKYENNPEEIWECDIFSCYCPEQDENYPYHCIGGRYDICIPYEGNEQLIGTTKEQAN